MPRKPPLTAAELMAQLERDPQYLAEVARRNSALAERQRELAIAEFSLVEALKAVDVFVASVWDLVNETRPYPRALPVLVEHFDLGYPPVVREGIARALAVPDAAFAVPMLLERYLLGDVESVKIAIAVALATAVPDVELSTLVRLVRNPDLGVSRGVFLRRLSRTPSGPQLLVEVATDPDIGTEAVALQKELERARSARARRRPH